MLWLALHFPQLGIEVAERAAGLCADPQAPRVLVQDNRVVQSNAAARRIGVQLGSTLATAYSLTDQQSPLTHFQAHDEQTSKRLQFLAELMYRFSSQVSPAPPDCLVLEVGRSLKLFGSFRALEEQVQRLCESLGHEACARTGATPSGALALARAGCRNLVEVPLSSLRLEAKVLERLANMGLHRLGQILDLPSKELGHRFGRALMTLLEQIKGNLPEPRPTITPSAQFRESVHLLEPIRSKDALTAPAQRLLQELGSWLVAHQLGASALVWRFVSHSKDQMVRLPITLSRAQQQPDAFRQITELKLANVELPEDVLSITLSAHRLEPWSNASDGLFRSFFGNGVEDQKQPQASEQECSDLLDQLAARLGRGACLKLHAEDQHAPEQSWAHQDAALPTPRAHFVAPLRRPVWLFSPPRPVDPGELKLLEGPERIQSGWWAEALARDYYVAEHVSGARCWAFTEPSAKWYLHGYFA